MPNHIHLLWRKQDNWLNKNVQQHFSKFTTQQIKFSLLADANGTLGNYTSTQNDRAYQFWERRPNKSTMYNRKVLEQKLGYIHANPLRKNLCVQADEYYYSSANFYLKNKPNELLIHYMEHI